MPCHTLLLHFALQPAHAFSWLLTQVGLWHGWNEPFFLFCSSRLSLSEGGLSSYSSTILYNSDQRELPDESDRFMMDPVSFVSEFSKNWSTPSHVVLFNAEERLLRDFLTSHSFKEVHAKTVFIFIFLLFLCVAFSTSLFFIFGWV